MTLSIAGTAGTRWAQPWIARCCGSTEHEPNTDRDESQCLRGWLPADGRARRKRAPAPHGLPARLVRRPPGLDRLAAVGRGLLSPPRVWRIRSFADTTAKVGCALASGCGSGAQSDVRDRVDRNRSRSGTGSRSSTSFPLSCVSVYTLSRRCGPARRQSPPHLVFQVFQRHLSGEVLRYHRFESFDRADLPGADGPDLWAGMHLGQAGQVTQSGTLGFSGVLNFRPYVWFERSGPGSLPGAFAVTPEAHAFLMEIGPDNDRSEGDSERFIGGPGRPL
jgi:hypothetical protein